MKRSSERGNVLWFILIAIVLLGGLTMLLSRSGSSVDQSGDVEQMRIKASQVLRYAKSIESALEQMRMNGVSENSISFKNTITATNYTNAACPDDGNCRVFDVAGAGLTYQKPPAGANDGSDWIFTGANNVGTAAGPVGTTQAASGNDLIMLMANANAALCLQINRDLEVGTSGTIPEDTTGIVTTEFTGTYADSLDIIDGDPTPFELDRKSAGCFTDTAANPDVTYFYYVLLAR